MRKNVFAFSYSVFLLVGHFLIPFTNGQGLILVTNPAAGIVTPAVVNTNCQCTAPTNCADGQSLIDPRVLNNPGSAICTAPNRFCCNLINPNPTTAPTSCGVQPLLAFPGFVPAAGQASYTEYPWMVVILGTDNTYIGGGALIDATTVVTVAHKVTPLTVGLVARVGEFILNAANEPYAPLQISVSAIRLHPQYNSATLENDIAILKLATAIDFNANPHIRPICLPPLGTSFAYQRCWVSGYGANSFVNGVYSPNLREVDVPVLDGATCQARLQTTRLGASYILNQQTFVCAGGEAGKDACTGDGGSPLVCLSGTTWQLVGLVAWGVGCGLNSIPGVYTSVANHINFITNNRY